MSKCATRFVLGFHNFCGTLNIKYEDESYCISRLVIIWNLVQVTMIVLVNAFIASDKITSEKEFLATVVRAELIALDNFSIFSKMLIDCSTFTIQVLSISLCSIQLWKRGEIRKILNMSNEFILDEESQKKLQKVSTRNVIFSLFYFAVILTLQFIMAMKPSVFSIVVCFIFMNPYLVTTSFLSFMKNYEVFFVLLLKQFRRDLKILLRKSHFDDDHYQSLLRKYQKIYALNKEYKKTFGAQMTLVTCCLGIYLTIDVRFLL